MPSADKAAPTRVPRYRSPRGDDRAFRQCLRELSSERQRFGYRRRIRVGAKMHCVKLLGQRLMARDFDRQVAKIRVRIAVLNG